MTIIKQNPINRSSSKIRDRKSLQSELRDLRRRGKIIVFTNGCFDLIHPGHLRYLEEAKSWGDILVVALNSDSSVKKIKGPDRPVMDERSRSELIAGLHCVDYVTIFSEETPQKIIDELLPGVLVKGGDWNKDQIVGRETVERHGGKVLNIKFETGYSTTGIIRKIEETFQRKKPSPAD